MKPEAQRIAIAEACPFVEKYGKGELLWRWQGRLIYFDPLNDLNAVHEAERASIIGKEELEERYWLALYDVCKTTRWPFDATAAHRAEAFLRTLNLWGHDA
jgi:hypothetical protein